MPSSGEPLVRDPGTTAANWQESPYNRWSFWHPREVLPTQLVSRGDRWVRQLPDRTADHDVLPIDVTQRDGSPSTVAEVFDRTYTDAYAVVQDGVLVAEGYAPTGGPGRTHVLMSISKSVVGCVAAILAERGQLDVGRAVTDYVPELAESGYAGATLRDLLDMRSGVRFHEDYSNPHAEIRRLDKWIMSGARRPSEGPRGLYPFLTTLSAEAPHGTRFLYRSCETDVLGWVCERAAGERMAELISTLIWAPMGAEHHAEIFCDTLGTAVHDGGLAATARDVARFGQLLLDGGSVPDGSEVSDGSRQVLPARWLRDSWAVNADVRSAFVDSPAELSFPGGWYRNQFWFRPGQHGDVLLCLGIHGQMLHVSRRTRTVCVKLSSWPDAQNPPFMNDTLRAFDAIGGELAHRTQTGETHRLPGVVAGTRRHGTTSQPTGGSIV